MRYFWLPLFVLVVMVVISLEQRPAEADFVDFGTWVVGTLATRKNFKTLTGKEPEEAFEQFWSWLQGHDHPQPSELSQTSLSGSSQTPSSPKREILFDINSIASLLIGDGWDVYVSEGYQELLKRTGDTPAVRVCSKGKYNTGKTWLLQMLSGTPLHPGYTLHTKGLSITPHQIDKLLDAPIDVLFVDSAGSNVPVSDMSQVLDRRLTDAFLQELIFLLCDIDLFVVNQITLSDQLLLNSYQERLRKEYPTQSVKERMFLLHNLKDIERVDDVQTVVKADIIEAFNATKGDATGTYYVSENFYHLIMARENTPAGVQYNEQTIKFLQIKIASKMDKKKVYELFDDVINYSKRLLQEKYLVKTKYRIADVAEAPAGMWQKIRNFVGVLVTAPAHPTSSDVALKPRYQVNERFDLDLTYRNNGELEKGWNQSARIVPLGDLDEDISISPYIEFMDDGFVDFSLRGLFDPHMTMGEDSKGNVIITLDVPGVSESNITLAQIAGDRISISGCRVVDDQFQQLYRQERSSGCFEKRVHVPNFWIDSSKIEKTHKNGVYTVTLTRASFKIV